MTTVTYEANSSNNVTALEIQFTIKKKSPQNSVENSKNVLWIFYIKLFGYSQHSIVEKKIWLSRVICPLFNRPIRF